MHGIFSPACILNTHLYIDMLLSCFTYEYQTRLKFETWSTYIDLFFQYESTEWDVRCNTFHYYCIGSHCKSLTTWEVNPIVNSFNNFLNKGWFLISQLSQSYMTGVRISLIVNYRH